MSRSVLLRCLPVVLAIGLGVFVALTLQPALLSVVFTRLGTAESAAAQTLRAAFDKARAADAYRLRADIEQTLIPQANPKTIGQQSQHINVGATEQFDFTVDNVPPTVNFSLPPLIGPAFTDVIGATADPFPVDGRIGRVEVQIVKVGELESEAA